MDSAATSQRGLPPVIGLCGPIGAGKDSVADVLVRHFGYHKRSFAAPLKAGAAQLFGVPPHYFEDRALKETPLPAWGLTPRKMLQWLGTDVLRDQFDPDFLAKRMRAEVDQLRQDARQHGGDARVVVSDVRFDNEAEFVIGFGGIVVSVEPGGRERPHTSGGGHASELGIRPPLVSDSLDNSGTLADLEAEVRSLLERQLV